MLINVYLLLTVAVALLNCSKSQNNNTQQRYGSNNVIIPTTLGKILGRTEKIQGRNACTVNVDVFWGIPFAKPPVGDLRFKRPEPSEIWDGVFEATTPPNSCVQVRSNRSILLGNPPTPMSEDCLYLNIWRPNCPDARRRMATMLWVHGGSFTTGSTAYPVYNGATLAAFECVIVASVNYRLGPFGFMYSASEEVPGNMGVLDVALALSWIKNNVANFGGNPNIITLFGNSAGAAILSMFLFSPLTRDFFHNAIIQSGNPFSKIFHQSEASALSAADTLARAVNCSSLDSPNVFLCLREVNATYLAETHAILVASDALYSMGPVTDHYFLTQDPKESILVGDVKRCSIMIGTTKDEGTFFLRQLAPKDYDFSVETPPSLDDDQLTQVLTRLFLLFFKEKHIEDIVLKMRTLYDYDNLKNEVANPSLTLLNYILRDLLFVCPANSLAKVYATLSQDVYMYSYNYVRQRAILPGWVGATHASEIPLVFRTTTPVFPEISPKDGQVNEKIMELWGNFAQFGNPTLNATIRPTWTEYTQYDPAIMVFREDAGQIIDRANRKFCDYWSNIPPEFFNSL